MRAICEAGVEHNLHVLLVGRPSLEANLDQLTVYCSDVDIKSGYTLQPFTEEETGQYLNFRLMAAGLAQDSREEIFTDGAVNKIHKSAQGNPRLINILAEESLQASCTDKSFLVLLDHVAEKGSSPGSTGFTRVVPPLFQKKKIVFVAVGALALVLLLFFMLNGGNEKNSGIVAISGHQVEAPPALEEPEIVRNPAAASTGVVNVADSETVSPPVVEENTEPPVEQQPLPAATPEEQIVNLQPDHVKVAPVTGADETEETGAAEIRVRPVEIHPTAVTVPVARGNRDGTQLFQSRIRASAKWLASAYHNRYTVQLMMLASEQAATNIKKILTEDDYFAIKDNLYILTKKTSPPTLFVFYGTYDSMEQARQARNNMPLFLRKHHPYPNFVSAL
jgi:septal ring-binding cell division protein DamX